MRAAGKGMDKLMKQSSLGPAIERYWCSKWTELYCPFKSMYVNASSLAELFAVTMLTVANSRPL